METTIQKKVVMMNKRMLLMSVMICMVAAFSLTLENAVAQTKSEDKNVTQLSYTQNLDVKWSADPSVTAEFENTPLDEALKVIAQKAQAGIYFNSDLIPDRYISYNFKKQPLSGVLLKILEGTNLKVHTLGRNIILREKEKEIPIIKNKVVDIQETVQGQVTDAETGHTLPGVNIIVKGTTIGTSTNISGEFELSVQSLNDTLMFSFIGYQTQEVAINGRTRLDIAMQLQTVAGEELVVVGYGTQERVNVTGSISSVTSDFLENRQITNSSQALQGLRGLHVNQVGSQPGADDATLRIRGVGTLNNNDPLVLVNGVEYDLRDINPNDIESISVLKDAASAAIYGNRASNGVVLITTKGGQEGDLQVDYNTYVGIQQATYLPDAVTDAVTWMESLNQGWINEGQPPPFTAAQIEEYRNGTDPYIYPNTDWFDLMFDPAFMQEHNLRLAGGSDLLTYSVSVGYLDQNGIMMSTDANKYSFNSNLTFDVSQQLQLGFILSGTQWDYREPASGIRSIMGSAITRSLPIDAPLARDGSYGGSWLENAVPGRTWRNPLAWAKEGGTDTSTLRLLGNVFAKYDFASGFTYNLNFAVKQFDGLDATFVPEAFWKDPKDLDTAIPLRMPDNRHALRENSNNRDISFFQTLEWKGDISERSSVNALGGFSLESFNNTFFMSRIEGFLSNELTELNAGTTNREVAGTSTDSRLMSFFGRAGYNYSDRYILEFNVRYDGSSRFAEGERWGLFPSVSAAWRIEQESFMQGVDFINNLKLRASWGQLGNQSIPLFSYVNKIDLDEGYSFNNNVAPGSAVTALADPNITWETTTITNIGIDLGVWESRLEFVVDVFDKYTEDILTQINLAGQVGNLGGPVTNLYSMSNKGIEVGANYANSIDDFVYSVGGSITYVDNKVDFMNGDEQYGSGTRWGDVTIIKEGYPVNSFYLYKADGLFRSRNEIDAHVNSNGDLLQPLAEPGDIRYRDVNGDGVINSDDRIITGNTVPEFTYDFNINLNYKNFDLSAFFQGVLGINGYPSQNFAYPNHNGAGLTKFQLANSWTPENPDAPLPRLTQPVRGSQRNYILSTFWLKDMSYLRLKNLQLGYNLPASLLNRINLNRVRVYANAQNLLTFSDFTLADPERPATTPNIYYYPTARTVSLGLNINF